MPQKLITRNKNYTVDYIPEAQLGMILSVLKNKIKNIGQGFSDIVDSIPGTDSYNQSINGQIVRKKSNPKYDPQVERLQSQLYDIGAFGNLSRSKAVDGVDGQLTQKAVQKAEQMGYSINGSKVSKNSNFLERLKNAWDSVIGNRKPSLEEFKEKKRRELREQAARVNSQVTLPNFPQMNIGPEKGHDMDVRGKRGWDNDRIRKEFTKYARDAEKYLKENPNLEPLAKQRMREVIEYYKKVASNPAYIDTHGGGYGCIYTASGAYGDAYRKQNNKNLSDAIARGEDTGFIQIQPNSYEVGDIIQIGVNNGKTYKPHHAEMVTDTFMGYPKLAQNSATGYGPESKSNNWSNAMEYTRRAKDSGEEFRVLRFVGTKDQNKKWEEEYYRLYG